MNNQKSSIYVIGCGVLGPEISHLANELSLDLKMNFLPGGLHNTPDLLRTRLQEAINEASADPTCVRIVIGYGLCGKGTVGIEAHSSPLVFPRVHDCIALFLGSDQAYRDQFNRFPGTFYISEGWRQEKSRREESGDKLLWIGSQSRGEKELRQQFGKKAGGTIIDFFSSWKENYQRAAFIHTGVGNTEKSEQMARTMAEENKWDFATIPGDLTLLRDLLTCTESTSEILVVPPYQQTRYSAVDNGLGAAPLHVEDNQVPAQQQLIFAGEEDTTSLEIRYGLGVDAGGTYTDAVLYDFVDDRIIDKSKSLTTKWDFSIGISNALDGLEQETLTKVELVSVSTTLATNAIVEGEGQRTGLILMDNQRGEQLIQHNPRKYIKGLMSISGQEVEAVDTEEVRQVARELMDREGVSAFAVSGYGGAVNPAHELLVKQVIAEESGKFVCCGHEFSTRLNFVIRAQTAVLNARIIPRMMTFFQELDQVLAQLGITAPVLVVKGDGTLMAESVTKERPVETILSGPAASVAGARHLTGLKDALVVDIGGTTTDTADIIEGEVGICDSGAVVGGFSTHVRALNMTTVGLGGDSFIKWKDGRFSLGPRRVAPLVWAGEITGKGLKAALASMAVKPLTRQEQIFFVAMDGEFPFTPSEDESRIYDLLQQESHTLEMLVTKLGKLSRSFLPIERLEESGLIQRCGLTPTDLLHVRGDFCRWDSAPAKIMLQLLAQATKKSPEALVRDLLRFVRHELTLELVRNQLFGDYSRADLEESELYQHVAGSIVSKNGTRFDLKLEFQHPIIGIGAPTHFFLPGAGKVFNAEVIIPEDADVANAIGAITSHVLVHQELRIRPGSLGGFCVEGVAGTKSFPKIAEAQEWVVNLLKEQVREKARESGTSNRTVIVDIDDQLAPLNDGTSLFLERTISATLKGSPDLALNG